MAAPPTAILFLFLLSTTAVAMVSREFFPMGGDVAWVVQVSDLHLSAYHPERADDLVRLLAPALRAIRPALLLVTGDITDAKNKKRTTTRQDEFEWVQYRNAVDAIVRQSGIDKRIIFDIRGNHDKYGVPYIGSDLDFFSIHSGNERIYIFLGIDDTVSIGFRSPSNFFGHATDRRINDVESELQYWDSYPNALATKVTFGHFPMSFIASSEKGERYENIFARQSVSAYICGHLHAKLSKQLWRIHTIGLASEEPKREKQFWEWELGDWKEFRLIRILAVDRGEVSFLDISLPSKSGPQEEFQTTILITYPIDSRSMNRIESSNHLLRNDINALVFSVQPILNVTAKVFDSSRAFRVVEEIPLQLSSNSATDKSLFHAKWNAESYMSASATRYWLQVFVLDSLGKETASTLRPFSVEGKMAHYSNTWLSYLVLNVQWEKLFSALLWSNISFLFTLLSLPKLMNHFIEKNPSYQRWATSVSISKPIQQRRILFSGLWFLIEGSRSKKLWFSMVIFLLYLLTLPWFWGHATSENGDIATMYMFGWKVQVPDSFTTKERLGTPDIMIITLPFMYMVVTPLILLIYSLFAERSAACLRSSWIKRCSDGPMSSRLEPEQRPQFVAEASPKSSRGTSFVYKVLGGWTRRIVLLVCLAVACIHLKLSSVLMEFYDIRAVTWSPAVACGPLFLLGAAIYSTITDS